MAAKWKKRSEETNAEHIEKLSGGDQSFDKLLFGDSMFERFVYSKDAKQGYKRYLKDIPFFNAGVGGDKISNMLWRLTQGGLLDCITTPPKQIIILAGANDIGCTSFDNVIAGYEAMLTLFREKFPESKIHIIAIYPRWVKKMTEMKSFGEIERINIELCHLASRTSNVVYEDFTDDVFEPINDAGILQVDKDKYFVDDVHFSKAGYNKFAKRLSELME